MGGRVERDCVVSFLDYYTMGPKDFHSKLQFILTFWFHKIFSHVVVTLLKKIKICEIVGGLKFEMQHPQDLDPIVE